METDKIAALLMNATATVFAAKQKRRNADSVTLDSCGEEVFTAWQSMVKRIGKDAAKDADKSFLEYAREDAKKRKKRDE